MRVMPRQPWLVIIGGPNAAGKTTFARAAAPELSLRYVAADLIADELGIATGGADAVRAGRLFAMQVHAAVSRGESLLVESTLSGLVTRRLIRRARAAGYRVSVGFVYVDSVEACIHRIRARVRRGGHPVPDHDVRRRFRRSLLNFWERYRFDADAWHLTYNGGEDAVRVAFGNGPRAVVIDSVAFGKFLGLLED
jgi:predicted ABC-type ATPase